MDMPIFILYNGKISLVLCTAETPTDGCLCSDTANHLSWNARPALLLGHRTHFNGFRVACCQVIIVANGHCARTRCFLPAHRWNKTVMVRDKMLPTCIVRIEGPSITLPPSPGQAMEAILSTCTRNLCGWRHARALLSHVTWSKVARLPNRTRWDPSRRWMSKKSYNRLKGTDWTSRLYSRYCMSSRLRWQTDKQSHRDA